MLKFIDETTAVRIASFRLDGEKQSLIPSEMKKNGRELYRDFGNLRALLSFESGAEYGLWTLRFENIGAGNTRRVTEACSVDLDVPVKRAASLHTLRGDDCSASSFMPVDLELDGPYSMKPNGGRSSCTTAFPYFDLTDGCSAALFAIGWTGQWRCELAPGEGCVNVRAGLENCNFYLKPGESVRGASVFYMARETDPKTLRREFKKLTRRDFNPVRRTGKSTIPFSIQPFDRYFYGRCPEWPTVAGQLKTLEGAKKCGGFDTLWIDAAWFRDGFPSGVGNYSFESGFPDGLKPVADAVHAAGMRFMVWFEPERIYRGSEVFENQPEFLLSVSGDQNTKLYNLGDEKAWSWLHNTLKNFIADNGIDNYRQDFNMEPLRYWLEADKADGEGRTGVTEMKYIAGLYRLWDALLADFPNLLIDDCSSGGRRIDFETMRRSVPMWRSDTNCGPATDDRHNYTWNQNHTLELAEYLIYHAGAAWEPITYRVRSASTAGFAGTFDVLNPDYDFPRVRTVLGEAARLADYWQLDFYPMSEPTNDESGFCAWRFETEAHDRGCVYIFRRNVCENSAYTLAITTLDADKDYELKISDENHNESAVKAGGRTLVSGYELKLDAPMSSMVVEYKLK